MLTKFSIISQNSKGDQKPNDDGRPVLITSQTGIGTQNQMSHYETEFGCCISLKVASESPNPNTYDSLVYILHIFLFIPELAKHYFCFQPPFLSPIIRFFGYISRKVFWINSKKKSKIVTKFWLKPIKFLQNIYMWTISLEKFPNPGWRIC